MTSEVDVDLASIRDEEILRRMWLETEDFGRKKDIRACMYKLREARLREFYVTGEMDSTDFGITKAPLKPSHGDSLADQSFQSFKSKEIRDSESPNRELKYTRGGVIVPDTSGWNVVTSSEVSPDGKSYKTESLATTEGTQKLTGGHSEFAGKNEHMQKASHQGDDKNFVETAAESSKTQLQEKTVVGDENSGRVEQKSSSVFSSSHMSTSKHSSSGPEAIGDHHKVLNEFDQLIDSAKTTKSSNTKQQQQHQSSVETRTSSSTTKQEHQVKEQQHKERQHQHYQQKQNERHIIEDSTNQDRFQTNQVRTTDTNQGEQVKRKLIQEEIDILAATPGKVISRSVDYPDPNTKVITETKTLPDGTTVTTRKYETKSASSKSWSTSSNQKESTSSRTIVEDRAHRNRVGYVVDGKEHVVSDDYSVKRITGEPSPQILRDTDRRTTRNDKQHQDEHTFTQQTVKQQQVHDRTDRNVQRAVTKEDKIHQHETLLREQTKKQDSDVSKTELRKVHDIRQTDATDRTEKLKDQAERIALDSTHRTIKKDLNQTVRDAKITNLDFIETEKGCSMVDYTQRSPEKYVQEPQTDRTVIRHQIQTTQDNRDHSQICREPDGQPQKTSPDFTTHGFPSARPQKQDQPRKPSQDFTTQGFPSVRSQKPGPHDVSPQGFPSTRPQKPDQDFTTHGFPSAKTPQTTNIVPVYPSTKFQKPGDHLGEPQRIQKIDDNIDVCTSKTTQSYATENVVQSSVEAKQVFKSTDQRNVTKQTEDYTTHGFPSVKPEKLLPARTQEVRKEPVRPGNKYPDNVHDTKHMTETRQTTEERKVHQETQDFTTHGFPSVKPDRSSRQPTTYATPNEDHRHYETSQRTVNRQTEDFTTHGFPSARPERGSPVQPDGKPKQLEGKPSQTSQRLESTHTSKQVENMEHISEDRQTTEQRHIHKESKDFSTHGFPSVKPDKSSPLRSQDSPRYDEQPTRSIQHPGRTYPAGETQDIRNVSSTMKTTEQRDVQRRQEDLTTQELHEYKPHQPDQIYPSGKLPQAPSQVDGKPYQPDQRYPSNNKSVVPEKPGDVPRSNEDFTTHGFPSARPQKIQEHPSPASQPGQTYPRGKLPEPERDFDDNSSFTTEHTDISESGRRKRNEFTSSRITVEVDAAHDAFARSLRCVSPVDQQRGSVKSLRTSTSSIRSSTSPDKRSYRSPSRDSESSRFSSSTITKGKDRKDLTRKVTATPVTKKSPLNQGPGVKDIGRPKDQPDLYRPKDTEWTTTRTETDEFTTRGVRPVTKDTRGTEDVPGKTKGREPITIEYIDRTGKPITSDNVRNLTTKPQPQTVPNRITPKPITASKTKDVTDTTKTQLKHDSHTTRSDTTRPYTIHGPIPKEYPEGYVPRKDVYPSVPKVSRSPHSGSEGSTRPGHKIPTDRGTHTSRPVDDIPKSPKKPDSKTPTRPAAPKYSTPTSPNKKDTKHPTASQTEPRTPSDTTSKFTKTVKIENAITRDTGRSTVKKSERKLQSSEDEGFEPDSPRSASPPYRGNSVTPTSKTIDMDATDITVEVNLKNIGRDVDLVTTITGADNKHYVNEKFIKRERDNVHINRRTKTDKEIAEDSKITEKRRSYDNDRNVPRQILTEEKRFPDNSKPDVRDGHYPEDKFPHSPRQSPNKEISTIETHYPNETGEPFYLTTSEPKSDDKKPGDTRKPKPPLNRSETYEERCRKILALNDSTIETETKETKEAKDFISTERSVQERDRITTTQSPVPSPRSASPRKPAQINGDDSVLVTTTETVTKKNEIKSRSPTYSPTRKFKEPVREVDDDRYSRIPKDSRSPSVSPYSSLSRKSTPKDTPTDTPHSRSPAVSPSRKRPTYQEFLDQSSRGSPRPSPSPTRRTDVEHELSTQRRSEQTRVVKQETFDIEDDSEMRKIHHNISSVRRSPSPRSPASSPERKPLSYGTTEVKLTENKTKTSSAKVDRLIANRSPRTSPTRREPYTTEVCYEISDRKIVKDKIGEHSPKSRSPTVSPTRKTQITQKVDVKSPSISPVRKTPSVARPTGHPSKPASTIETTTIKKTTDRTTDILDVDRKINRTSITDVPHSTQRSPIRRGPQIVESKTTLKRTTPDTSRSPVSAPSRLKTPASQPNRSRYNPLSTEYETTIHKETKDHKIDTSRKTSSATSKTTKTIETMSPSREHPSHVTSAKIQLSPTPTRKISSPEKRYPKEPEVKSTKSPRSMGYEPKKRDDITKESKPIGQRYPVRQPVDKLQPSQPGRRIDTKKTQETSTQQQRRLVEKKIKRVEDESDSSMVRETEEVSIIRETKTSPFSPTEKRSPKRIPVTERKESAPVYGSRSTIDTSQKMTRSTSDNLIKTSVTKRTKPDIVVGPSTKTPRKLSADKSPGKSERRPSKHLATKTINLSTTSHILNSEDMENVIIDIQQAKSSREPSPNKIIPTPVPLDEETGKARFPDTVQEPDEEPRRKPKVNNIPIFEEETNNFVGCHITEVDETYEEKVNRKSQDITSITEEENVLKRIKTTKSSRESTPRKDSKRLTEVIDDDSLLSVHDKVNKFIHTAEEVNKPKSSTPFRREPAREEFPETDDCLLSVNAKVNKFLSTADSITKPMKSPSSKPVGRPNIDEIEEELRTDECVLSVSEKVNKFINTAEKLVSPSPQRSPELVAKIEREISRQSDDSEKDIVSKTTIDTTVTERSTTRKPKPNEKPSSPKPALKSSEAIRKAKQVFENGTTTTTTTTSRQKDILSRPSVWDSRKTDVTDVCLKDIGVYKKDGKFVDEDDFERTERHRSRSPIHDTKGYPNKSLKTSSILTDSVSSKKDLFESRISTSKTDTTKIKTGSQTTKTVSKPSGDKLPSRKQPDSDDYYQEIRQPTSRSNYSPSRETKSPRSRSYIDDQSSSTTETVHVEKYSTKSTESSQYPSDTSPSRYSTPLSPKRGYEKESPKSPSTRTRGHTEVTSDSVSAKRNLFEKSEPDSRTTTPTAGPRPSYMDHTLSSLEHIRRDSVEVNKSYLRKSSIDSTSTYEHDGTTRSGVKFGVELKHIDSKSDRTRRRSSSSEIPHIEDIFDLELLEQMLHTVVGYEQRRRIRVQIRLVKKMIETQNRDAAHTEYTRIIKQERSSSRGSTPSPDRHYSPTRKESIRSTSSRFIETESEHISRHVEKVLKERSLSPSSKIERFETIKEVRKGSTGKTPGKKPVVTKDIKDEKPIWATRNVLKKTSEKDKNTKTTTSSSSSTSVKKTSVTSKTSQKQKIISDEDCITSGYGIGPTDEDGKPLFGIRALKKKPQPSETTKVTGSVITEKYYSENGAQPVGERKVTVYSTSPDDVKKLESKFGSRQGSETIKRERSSKDGVTTVTRVDKISKVGDTDEQEIPAILDSKASSIVSKPTKLVRKGSVKEISERFTRKESSSSMPEKISSGSYPKAGLILRTHTHTNRSLDAGEVYIPSDAAEYDEDSGEETIPVGSDNEEEIFEVGHRTQTSFLNSSGRKVTGVNDVLNRMRNADNVVEEGDTAEDREARSLLNKFLGASVLMSGMESMVSKQITSTNDAPDLGIQAVKTTRVTKTVIKEDSSAPVDLKTCDIEDIWDENTLKELLEKSTQYEERRRIRARIRQLMAEREACADIVASVKAELQNEQEAKVKIQNKSSNVVEEESDEESGSSEYEEIEEIVEEEVEEAEEDDEEEDEEVEEGEESGEESEDEKDDSKKLEKKEQKVVTETTTVMKINPVTTKKEEEQQKPPIKEDTVKAKTQEQGESLLLPLLQGLLHKNTPQAHSQTSNEVSSKTVNNNTSGNIVDSSKTSSKVAQVSKQSSEKSTDMYNTVHHVEDSGTESGEDLKFIAAGLRSSMQMHSMKDQSDSDIISEVTAALNRLEQSLKGGNDLKLELSKKNALLNLVGRLQTSLISPEKITAPTLSPGQNPAEDNETSSPEADARRGSRPGHQRFAKRRNRASRHTVGVSREELADARRYIEEMVMMETLSNCTTPESSAVTPPEFVTPVEKITPNDALRNKGPESSTLYRPNQFVPSHLKDSSTTLLNPPGVQLRDKKSKNPVMRQSADFEAPNTMVAVDSKNKRPLSDSYDRDENKVLKPHGSSVAQCNPKVQPDQTVIEKNLYNKTHHSVPQNGGSVFNGLRPSAYTAESADSSKMNRFSNKKLMMKRANTIDIPKPMRYINDMESDSEAEERGISSIKGIGLRGTVQVSVKGKPRQVVPQFQPKTENDHKFLAFIKKQSPTHGLGWNNPNKNQSNTVTNWSNKFGNIKTAFETGAIATSGKPPVPASSARNFWKKTETNLPQTDRGVKPPWTERTNDVLTGALKAKQQPENQSGYVPKPIPVNQFSHAPLSAFRPVESVPVFPQNSFQPINPNNQSSYPVFGNQAQQSPTKALFAGRVISNSPTSGLPWASKPNVEHRVLSMAASKFGSKSPTVGLQRHGSLREHERIPVYNNSRVEQKRPSLPNTSQYNSNLTSAKLVHNYQSAQYNQAPNVQQEADGNFPALPYTCTDYTEPSCVSTYIPENQRDREDSLTNPNSEPLVLTSNRPIISPNMQSKQQQPLKIFDYPSSPDSPNHTLNDVSDDELDRSLTEYKAESRVMKGPVSQQAVTVSNRTARVGGDEKYGRHSKAAKSLLSVMKNISIDKSSENKVNANKPTPQSCVSPDGSSYQAPHVEPVFPTLSSPTTNRMPSYCNQQSNINQQYQSQRSLSHQSQPTTPQSQTSAVSYHTQSSVPYSVGSLQTPPVSPQVRNIPYQAQTSVPYSTSSYSSQPTTPQSPQQPIGYYQPNPAYLPPFNPPHSVGSKHLQQQQFPKYQEQAQYQQQYQNKQQSHYQQQFQYQQPAQYQPQPQYQQQPQYQEKPEYHQQPQYQQQYTSTPSEVFPKNQENVDKFIEQQRNQIYLPKTNQALQQTNVAATTQKPALYKDNQNEQQKQFIKQSSQELKRITQENRVQKSQEVHEGKTKAQQTTIIQKNTSGYSKSPAQKEQTTQKLVESGKMIGNNQKIIQKAYSMEEKNDSTRQIQRQNATETGYQKQLQKKQVQTEISAEATSTATKTTENLSTITQQKSSISTETKVYKSSQPEDTPDIVKSSLPKEDFPILKKFGPARPHLYHPNCYQYPLAKSESTKQVKLPSVHGPTSRKFSEPSVVTKFTAPEIVETPSTPLAAAKDEIPANIVFRNIAQFTSMGRKSFDSAVETTSTSKFPSFSRPNPLSKSDSWHQIVQQQNAVKPPSPKGFAASEGNPLRRAKSGHSLAVPKMFEAGMKKEEVIEKQKTVAAYFSGQKSPNSLSRNSSQTNIAEMAETSKTTSASISMKKSSISRIRTTEKASINNQIPSSGLARSQTMPHMANLHLLDENLCTTQTTESKQEDDGAIVTTTTKVITRTVAAPPKPISPFAKFRQLDKQTSLQSPSSPLSSSPGGANRGAHIFKFTDPSLNARAATAKEQLLQWCQMKTKEYENVQITNFSASWTDGLAFCALIHHFLPNAFDYTKLTPQQRRYNFELAFRVADEEAGIAPLLDVEDMVVMKRPDWKCVFTYVQSIYRRFRNCQ